MPNNLKVPLHLTSIIEVKKKWLGELKKAQATLDDDATILAAAKKGMHLKDRNLPPEVLGRSYVRYCQLINQMYDSYLNNVQLQRAPYILDIITVILKRMYELRDELVHIIVNDYIYTDTALQSFHMTPVDIEIVVPYHFPLEFRSENVEQLLQQMWIDTLKRKRRRERPPKQPKPRPMDLSGTTIMDHVPEDGEETENVEEEEESESEAPSVHTIIPEDYIHALTIQRCERLRIFRVKAASDEDTFYKQYYSNPKAPVPMEQQIKSAILIQMVCREFMKIKRKRIRDNKRDVLLGILPDPFTRRMSYAEENNKIYEKRRNMRLKMYENYLKDMELERIRLIVLRKDNHLEDITDEIMVWFKEWFYGYRFFPQFPYEMEGGTILVVRGDYPTVEEQYEEDERILNATKGKTKEQLEQEKERVRMEEEQRAEVKRQADKKAFEALLKERCNPLSDRGYKIKQSAVLDDVVQALRNYRLTWSLYDEASPENYGETIYGYLMPLLSEDLMKEIHLDCRKIIDELMRIDLKLLIKKHQFEFKQLGWKYPKVKPRKRPPVPPQDKSLVLNKELLQTFELIFDLNIVTKPTTKFSDIYGDSSYAAYDYNIRDPYATYPIPGYGDIKGRLMLSCVLGCGIQPGAPRKKAVMLLGPSRNGKSFLVDAVAGELNAVKINISPEVFSAVAPRANKALVQVFGIAKAFQPAVVFMKDVERVFIKKVPPDQRKLKAKSLKGALTKLVKAISNEDKIIFIATCSDPWVANIKPMVNLFDEILLVPRTDYATVQQFFFQKFQSIRSMPRDYPVQPIAQLLQGYGFSDIIDVYNEVMTAERIVRLHAKYLSPAEFLEVFIEKKLEPLTVADYERYAKFCIEKSPLNQERIDYDMINYKRGDFYAKMAKKLAAENAQNEQQN